MAKALVAVAAGLAAAAALAVGAAPAHASGSIRYGIQDDAWLISIPGTLPRRLNRLDQLGVDLVRFNLRWDQVAQRPPSTASNHRDRAYRWRVPDAVLRGLRLRRIDAVVSIVGTPAWANGRKPSNFVPLRPSSMRNFAYAAAKRYPWVRYWLIWNEPNHRRWLRPTDAGVYVRRLLNPGYRGIRAANRRARVAGGVTGPRGGSGRVSPIRWMREMRAAGARLDAYAHHPYPSRPSVETPFTRVCRGCTELTMGVLDRLIAHVTRNFGRRTRVWLTEYAYQTNPPDPVLGVPWDLQARYIGEAALRAYRAPRVDMLIHYLMRDEPQPDRWQSGLFDLRGVAKPAAFAFQFPLALVSRRGLRSVVWGQVRPRSGPQPFRVQELRGRRWRWVGRTYRTNGRGFFEIVYRGGGTALRLWSPRDKLFSAVLALR